MIDKLVSVIIPVFNSQKFIIETLNSVKYQSYRPIEVLIIDDGSIDNTYKIVEEFISNNNTEDFKAHITNNLKKGAPSARNLGYSLAKGKYIQFLDSDDILLVNKIKNQISILKEKQYDVIYSKAQHIDISGKQLPYYWGRKLEGNSSDYFEFPWQTMCAIYTQEIIKEIGLWNENLLINQDWEFSLKFVIGNSRIYFIDEVQSYYRTGLDNNIGKSISVEKIESKEISTKNIFLLIKDNNNLDEKLRNSFFKRFMFVIVEYGKIGAWKQIHILRKFLLNEKLIGFSLNQILKFKYKMMYNLVDYLYLIKRKK